MKTRCTSWLVASKAKVPERAKRRRSRALFTVPYPDNPFFTERGTELRDLEDLLSKRGIAALTGIGGMGKTQTAAKYAYLHRDDYPAVLWARAENAETLYADFTRFAALLKLPESTAQDQKLVVEAVKNWLEAQARWLLVLDNVEDIKFLQRPDAQSRWAGPAHHGNHAIASDRRHPLQRLARYGRRGRRPAPAAPRQLDRS